jgi:hypothetical protein
LDFISASRNASWKVEKQEILIKDGRRYDNLIVKLEGINGNPMPLQLENHYFDIK